jgi:hypothetical protein
MLDKGNGEAGTPTAEDRTRTFGTPPRVAPLEAIANQWPIVAAVTIACVVIAIAVGLAVGRPYYADVQFTLSPQDLGAPGALTGFPETAEALSTSYSRAVTSDAVTNKIPRELRDRLDVDNLEASPIPESPVFRVTASGDSAEDAVDLVNAASAALVEYVAESPARQASARLLLEEYGEIVRGMVELEAEKEALEDGDGSPEQIEEIESTLRVERVRARALRQRYESSQSVEQGAILNLQGRASVSETYRSTSWLAYIGAGLLCGLVLGSAIATIRAQRRFRRFVTT